MSRFQRSVSVIMVGLRADARTAIEQAVRALWPEANLVAGESVDDALRHEGRPGTEILLLGSDVLSAAREQALAAQGADNLPRWPVIIFDQGVSTATAWFVPPQLRDAAELARILQIAATQHATVREAGRARGDLWTIARRISHEMRSPLGCILTAADVLREELAESNPEASPLSQPIIESAHELMELLDRLTLIARATVSPPAASVLDMTMVVWAARERLASRIRDANAEIHEPEMWPPAVGRADWLERVWQSLMQNALQHSGPKPNIELGWERRDGELLFFVRDHGTGVAPEVLPTLFRPFHQMHQSDSGRGLGLSVVQRLVELQGGHCGYEPVAPHGSYFYFNLPEDVCTPASVPEN